MVHKPSRFRRTALSGTIAALLLVLGACSSSSSSSSSGAAASSSSSKPIKIAWVMVLANSYTQAMLQGAEAAAAGKNVQFVKYDTGFSAQTQYNDIETIVAQHNVQGILVQPNDQVGIVPAVKAAIQAGIPVVTLNVPIGPSATTYEPQVPGLAGSVLTPQVTWGHQLGQMTVNACQGINPCRVAFIAGEIGTSGDDNMIAGFKAQIAAYKAAAAANSNIDVVAIQGGGEFLAGPAEGVAKNLLTAHPNLNVILSTGDQMTHGAELAVDALNMQGKVKLIGLGASVYGIAAVRAGRWYGTVVTLPQSIGRIGLQVLLNHITNPKLAPQGIDPAAYTHQNPLITKADIGNFQAQWTG
jgi:ribose transport system substrate-binding protein